MRQTQKYSKKWVHQRSRSHTFLQCKDGCCKTLGLVCFGIGFRGFGEEEVPSYQCRGSWGDLGLGALDVCFPRGLCAHWRGRVP